MSEEQEKKIVITGINNRYQMKKMINERKEPKKRTIIEKWNLSSDYKQENQLEILQKIYENKCESFDTDSKIMIQEIEKKIYGYRQQDIIKKRLDDSNLIKLESIIKSLFDCKLNCCFCSKKMDVIYEIVREMSQWSVDRINNDLGHNNDNFIIACLHCNLERRRKTKEAFWFQKNLNIIKQGNTCNNTL